MCDKWVVNTRGAVRREEARACLTDLVELERQEEVQFRGDLLRQCVAGYGVCMCVISSSHVFICVGMGVHRCACMYCVCVCMK